MKKILFLTILFCTFAVFSSEVKFALLGLDDAGKNAVELVQAELAGSIEFVERSNIGDIRQEQYLIQQFGIARLARCFAGADIFIAVQNNTLTAFETRYGFRLAYRKLSADFEKSTAEIKQEILKWNNAGKDFFKKRIISFAGIRNNLHRSLAGKAEKYSDTVKQAINQTPAILLEREYLVELLLEQELSGAWRDAVSGSEIIHFEFNPGSDAEEIIFAVYAVDAQNKTVFKNESTDLASVLSTLQEHCSRPPSKKRYTLKDEASRFAYEARIARDDHKLLLAEKLQFAAFALDPDNPKLFNFGIIANEKLIDIFPYWFAALKKIVRYPQFLKSYENPYYISERIINHIFCNQYKLPETLRKEYWNWLARYRHLWQRGNNTQKFRFVKKEFYPTTTEYLQAKEAAWQTLLSKNIPPQEMYSVSDELFQYQNSMTQLQRHNWTIATAANLRKYHGLEIMAKSLECNAFLHTKACTADAALKKFEELFALLKKYPDLKIHIDYLYDHHSVNAYIGLLEKVKLTYKKYKENQR